MALSRLSVQARPPRHHNHSFRRICSTPRQASAFARGDTSSLAAMDGTSGGGARLSRLARAGIRTGFAIARPLGGAATTCEGHTLASRRWLRLADSHVLARCLRTRGRRSDRRASRITLAFARPAAAAIPVARAAGAVVHEQRIAAKSDARFASRGCACAEEDTASGRSAAAARGEEWVESHPAKRGLRETE